MAYKAEVFGKVVERLSRMTGPRDRAHPIAEDTELYRDLGICGDEIVDLIWWLNKEFGVQTNVDPFVYAPRESPFFTLFRTIRKILGKETQYKMSAGCVRATIFEQDLTSGRTRLQRRSLPGFAQSGRKLRRSRHWNTRFAGSLHLFACTKQASWLKGSVGSADGGPSGQQTLRPSSRGRASPPRSPTTVLARRGNLASAVDALDFITTFAHKNQAGDTFTFGYQPLYRLTSKRTPSPTTSQAWRRCY
jgi:hypothetical protein